MLVMAAAFLHSIALLKSLPLFSGGNALRGFDSGQSITEYESGIVSKFRVQ